MQDEFHPFVLTLIGGCALLLIHSQSFIISISNLTICSFPDYLLIQDESHPFLLTLIGGCAFPLINSQCRMSFIPSYQLFLGDELINYGTLHNLYQKTNND